MYIYCKSIGRSVRIDRSLSAYSLTPTIRDITRKREWPREKERESSRMGVCCLLIALSLFPFPFPLRFCQIVDHAPIRCSRSVTAWYIATLAAPRQPKITHSTLYLCCSHLVYAAQFLPEFFDSTSSTNARSARQRLQLIRVSSRAPRF